MYNLIDMLKEAAGTTGKSSVTVVTSAEVCKALGGDSHFTINTSDGKVFYDIDDIEELFNTFDKLLIDGCTYGITVYPAMSLTLMTNEEMYVITCNSMIHDDLIELRETVDFHRNSVILPVRKVIHNVLRRLSMPLRVTINYVTMTAAHEETHKSPKVVVSEVEPESSKANKPNIEVVPLTDMNPITPKGYTNVIVGHEDVTDPIEHRNRLTAEVMQHIANVTSGNVHESIPTQAQPDIHIGAVDENEVKKYRERIFNEGLQELAKESKRKAEQPPTSTEDDFAV